MILPPRAEGSVILSVGAENRLKRLRQSASLKALFPRVDEDALHAVLVNTAGGATGGDRFSVEADVRDGAHLVLTTQAAERAYRAQPGQIARLRNRLFVGLEARLHWLPQEMLLFDGAALERRLEVELAAEARFVMCEALVNGRAAMGESVRNIRLRDRIEIRREGVPLFLDQLRIDGDLTAHLARPTIAGGAQAISLFVAVLPEAEALSDAMRPMLPDGAGLSLIGRDCLVARLVAPDSFEMRLALVPLLQRVVGALPRPWKI